LALQNDGSYVILSKLNTQYCLGVRGDVPANESNVILTRTQAGAVSQRFYIAPITQVLQNGTYTMSPLSASYRVIDIRGGTTDNLTPAILYSPNNGMNQRMIITFQQDSGYYVIAIAHSGKVLDVTGLNRTPGTAVIQYQSNGGYNQLWDISVASDGSYIIRSACNDLSLDVFAEGTDNLTPIIVWPYHGRANQRWRLIRVQ